MSSLSEGHHSGPIFPYRFSFERFDDPILTEVPFGSHFCRWTLEDPARAFEFSDEGKGKGVTAIPSDGPARCCSDRTPQLFIKYRLGKGLGCLIPSAPGRMYGACISGHGWYSADPGTSFFIRLVAKKEDVPMLREEALLFEQEPPGVRREPLSPKSTNANEPVAFHGFFQTEARDAAAIVLEFHGPVPEQGDKDEKCAEKPRKKKGKKKKRQNPTP